MRQKGLFEAVRQVNGFQLPASGSVEAIVFRRYVSGRVVHIRVDDRTEGDLEIPSDCKRVLVVIEMEIEELIGSSAISRPQAQPSNHGLNVRSLPPLP